MQQKLQILAVLFVPLVLQAQTERCALTLQEASERMWNNNPTVRIADKAIGMARGERQKLNAFWYPMLNTSGMVVHLSDRVEVKQPLDAYTNPAKEFVQSIIPNDQLISSILDQVGSYTLSVPILQRNLTTLDANLTWPIFTGGKRLYASQIGKRMVDIAEVGKEETNALLQTELVQTYYALQLAERIHEVRKQTFQSLHQHYNHALKLEANGLITKAERLFAEVNLQEAKREWEASKKEYVVAHQTLCSLLNIQERNVEIHPITPLFVTDELPDGQYFKNLIPSTNYTINKLRLEESMAESQLKLSKSAYLHVAVLVVSA